MKNNINLFLTLISFSALLSTHSKAITFDNKMDKMSWCNVGVANSSFSVGKFVKAGETQELEYDAKMLEDIRQKISTTGGILTLKILVAPAPGTSAVTINESKTFPADTLHNTDALKKYIASLHFAVTDKGVVPEHM